MKNIIIWFLPGAAGNFLSRCLNLLENVSCWGITTTKVIPMDIDSKFRMVDYADVCNRTVNSKIRWTEFEDQLYQISEEECLTEFLVSIEHPENQFDRISNTNEVDVYIDVDECFEWVMLNALYKDSMIFPHYLYHARELCQNNSVFKFSLKRLLSGEESFKEEFVRLCDFIQVSLVDSEIELVLQLYRSWVKTTISGDKLQEFKKEFRLN